MAVTDFKILSLPADIEYSAQTSSRPAMTVVWGTGIGPFDVVHKWDTVSTFDSGDLITVTHNSASSPDTGTPTSDLSVDTWYYKVSIYDHGDDRNEKQKITLYAPVTTTPTATATNDDGTNTPNLSVDGNDTTYYASSTTLASGTLELFFDFGAAVSLSKLRILQDSNIGASAGKIYWSDNAVDYTEISTFLAVYGWETAEFDVATHRYWKLQTTSSKHAYWHVNTVDFFGPPSAGTWRPSYNSNATGDLAHNISLSALETALEALTGITAVTVTGDPSREYNIEFTDPGLTDMLLLVVDDDSLTPTSTVIVITEEVQGSSTTLVVIPPTGTRTVVMEDSKDKPRDLYLYHNVIPAFGVGEVDDKIETPNDFYLYHNITEDQPCPWVEKITPTTAPQGSAVAIRGDGFGAAASTYQTVVRLYEDQDLSGAYVTMGTTYWSDDEISATVPAGASTGWVVLIQTNGSATCSGSEPKLLTVTLSFPNPDAGWWLRTANRFNVTDAEHTVLPGNNVKTSFRKIMNAIGSGQVEIPLGDPIINEFIDPVTRRGVLVQSWIDDQMRYGWFAETLTHDYDEKGNAVAVISGRGMEVVSLWNKILPHDYPASPTRNPTWVYGSNENFVQNPGFDDVMDNPILQNAGGEDGNDDDGNAEGWSKRGDDTESYVAIQSFDAMTGLWYIEVEASDNHSGIQQSVAVTANRTYHVRAYVKDPLASGMRVTLALGGADDIEATGTYANNFEFNNEILAELDNVPRNAAANGLPGGSTNGGWQVLDVEVKTGDEQTSLNISIQNDHHESGIFNPFWIDVVEIEGWGLGLEPWRAYAPYAHASNSYRLQTDHSLDGSPYGLYLNPLQTWAGIEQTMAVNPLTKYTMTLWMWTDLLHGDDTWKLEAHENDGLDSWIGTPEEKVPNDEGWTQYQIVFTTDEFTEELLLRFVYSGPNNPSPAYVDSISLVPGEPPATAGKILNDILDKMDEHGKLQFLTRTFTDELDSLGQSWPAPLSLDLDPSESLYGVLNRLVALGHEWEIVPNGFRAGGDTGFELNVYTARPFNPITGVGENFVDKPDGPVIMPSDATIGGRIIKSVFNVNTVMAIGDDGTWSKMSQHPWLDDDMPSGDPANHGYEDSFGVIEDVISVSAADATTIAQFAEARLADEKDRERTLQLDMQRSATFRPFLHINVGDSLFVDMPPNDADPPVSDGEGGFTRSYPKRIRSIQADLAGEGSDITFQVDIDRVIYEDQLAWNAMIAQLSERAPSDNSGQGTGSVSGTGGTVSVIVDGGTGSTAPHTHSLKSTDIRDKASSGDVSGSLPGPLTVNALKGRPVSRAIPAVSGSLEVVMVYDRDTLTWTPVNADVSVAAPAPAYIDSVSFSQGGVLVVGSGTFRLYAPVNRTIVDVIASVGGADTAGVVTFDVHKDGTTIFTTQANRPEIAALEFVSAAEVPDVTEWVSGSYLTVDIDNASDAEDAVVTIRYQEA